MEHFKLIFLGINKNDFRIKELNKNGWEKYQKYYWKFI